MPRGRPTGNTLDLKGTPFGWASGSIAGGLRVELGGRIAALLEGLVGACSQRSALASSPTSMSDLWADSSSASMASAAAAAAARRRCWP